MKKILLVADEKGWVFHNHCLQIQKRLPEYEIDIAFRKQDIRALSENYDLVYVLDPIALSSWPDPEKTIMGLRCEFMYLRHPQGPKGLYEKGLPNWGVDIKDRCSIFHVVNKRQLEIFKPIVVDKPLLLVQHGVDETIFDSAKHPITKHYDGKLQNLIVGTAGRSTQNKGFNMVASACDKMGIRFLTASYGNQKLTKEQMPDFYNALDIYICASKDEGLNNGLMEAGAMGLTPISTYAGAAPEMIENGISGLLIERNVESLMEALDKLKDSKYRLDMAEKFYDEILTNWTWKARIQDFRNMFEQFFDMEKEG